MSWAMVIVVLAAAIQVMPSLQRRESAVQQVLSFLDGTCDGVECGRGKCVVSGNGTLGLGHVCECDSGWSRLLADVRLSFLPCIIPNCTLNYTCVQDTTPPPAAPINVLQNLSFFDPCFWSYCGSGKCVTASSGFAHTCECDEGFGNLLNISSLPCFRDCVVGADCPNLGYTLSNASFPSPPPYFSNGGGESASSVLNNLTRILVLAILLASIGDV